MGPLTQRVLVAVISIPLLLALTFSSMNGLFFLLVVVMVGVALFEFFRLLESGGIKPLWPVGILGYLVLILAPVTFRSGEPILPCWAPVLVLFLGTLGFLWSKRSLNDAIQNTGTTLLGVFYFGILGSFFWLLKEIPRGEWMLLFLYTATWSFDTGAYFTGSLWGRHKITPRVSPNKSLEGCAGGLALCLLALFVLWRVFPIYQSIFGFFDICLLALILSTTGQLGDLVESMFKRSVSAKQSGSFFPGHGGVFDRIDSLLFNAPVLFYYLVFFKLYWLKSGMS